MCGTRDESLVLGDIVTAASRLVEVVSALPCGSLGNDPDVDDVVLWNLTVLGEASKRLSPAVRERFADVPWSSFARTRDVLVHHYEAVDWLLIEQICRDDLPLLMPRLIRARSQL